MAGARVVVEVTVAMTGEYQHELDRLSGQWLTSGYSGDGRCRARCCRCYEAASVLLRNRDGGDIGRALLELTSTSLCLALDRIKWYMARLDLGSGGDDAGGCRSSRGDLCFLVGCRRSCRDVT